MSQFLHSLAECWYNISGLDAVWCDKEENTIKVYGGDVEPKGVSGDPRTQKADCKLLATIRLEE